MTLVLDTNAYSAFRRDDEKAIELVEGADELIVPSIVACELMAGLFGGDRWSENWKDFQDFLGLPGVRLGPTGMLEAE